MRSIGLFLLVSVVAFGQRVGASNSVGFNTNAYARPNTFGSITGFGNVVFPGTGHAPVLNNSIRGNGVRVTAPTAGGRRFNGGTSFVYVPYGVGVPVYPEQAPAPVGAYGAYPQQQMAPQVVINQNFISETARPVVREYTPDANGGIRVYEPPSRAQAETEPVAENPSYLIAFKDHTIYMALAYWIEDGTLHYVTNQNTHNQVSLDLVDRELSDRLNKERGVDFRLPSRR